MNESVLAELMKVIEDRKQTMPEKSYTTKLFQGGVEKIGSKIAEEAAELIEAAAETGPEAKAHQIHEAADLLYHMLVLLGYCEVKLEDVEAELGRRFGISGLEEKAARKSVSE